MSADVKDDERVWEFVHRAAAAYDMYVELSQVNDLTLDSHDEWVHDPSLPLSLTFDVVPRS